MNTVVDKIKVELVGRGKVIVVSVDRGRAVAVSDEELLRALRALVAQSADFPESRLNRIMLPAEH